jgi:hypothetical protein
MQLLFISRHKSKIQVSLLRWKYCKIVLKMGMFGEKKMMRLWRFRLRIYPPTTPAYSTPCSFYHERIVNINISKMQDVNWLKICRNWKTNVQFVYHMWSEPEVASHCGSGSTKLMQLRLRGIEFKTKCWWISSIFYAFGVRYTAQKCSCLVLICVGKVGPV